MIVSPFRVADALAVLTTGGAVTTGVLHAADVGPLLAGLGTFVAGIGAFYHYVIKKRK